MIQPIWQSGTGMSNKKHRLLIVGVDGGSLHFVEDWVQKGHCWGLNKIILWGDIHLCIRDPSWTRSVLGMHYLRPFCIAILHPTILMRRFKRRLFSPHLKSVLSLQLMVILTQRAWTNLAPECRTTVKLLEMRRGNSDSVLRIGVNCAASPHNL